MSNGKRRVYITDFDFTLLQSNLQLPKDFTQFYQSLLDADVLFSVATARGIHALHPLMNGVTLQLPVVELNGVYLTDHASMKPHHIQSLTPEEQTDLIAISSELGLYPVVFGYTDTPVVIPPVHSTDGIDVFLEERRVLRDPRIHPAQHFENINIAYIATLIYMGDEQDILALYERFQKADLGVSLHYYENKYTPGYFWLSVHNAQATKEAGILRFLDHLKLTRDEVELVVFGDDVNDMGMFEIADVAVAVSNAKPELKLLADEIIGSNDEAAVIRYIQQYEALQAHTQESH
ncbi:MAG: HAD hydrolase family protein [Candidatus Kariarchaeaceae archaeon]|jgi:hydroxymethylpyrimidine pyrophosphatase-like HAD family hydrolase